MENYIVSARKYRPMTFDTVVGQHSLTTTLKNAIATKKLAHAYLFCGPRGVGKTTCARIFAKNINCMNPTATGEACNECESCKAFNEQRSFNIHELDAASNNSVEDIRSLIEQVRIPPQIGQYKVFIIDEVHMLSQAAFNAFLKTLEEPPRHAIFVLATTEKHKILPTILSRCQIYDFNRMSINDTVEHLKFVAEKEGIEAESEALNVIAQKADGGMRDALSIFDQVASFGQGKITYRNTIENLNVLDYEYYFRLTDHLLSCQIPESLLLLNEVLCKGFDGHHFITGFASHLRDLLVSKDTSTLSLLEASDNIRTRYAEQAKKCDTKFLYRAIKICNDCDLNYRTSKNKRLLIELTLIQVAQLTTEDEDSSCGRSPKKTLKPIFTKQSSSPVTITSNTKTQGTADTATVKSSSAGQASSAPDSKVIEKLTQRKDPTQEQTNSKRLNPSILYSPSIKIQQTTSSTSSNPTEQKEKTQQPGNENQAYDESKLNFHWLEFASLLPIGEKAMAQRMKNLRPKLLTNDTFEIVVNTTQFEKDLAMMKARIEKHLRTEIHNSNITMIIRVSQEAVRKSILSRPEQFKAMTEKNPALEKLRVMFELELD